MNDFWDKFQVAIFIALKGCFVLGIVGFMIFSIVILVIHGPPVIWISAVSFISAVLVSTVVLIMLYPKEKLEQLDRWFD